MLIKGPKDIISSQNNVMDQINILCINSLLSMKLYFISLLTERERKKQSGFYESVLFGIVQVAITKRGSLIQISMRS